MTADMEKGLIVRPASGQGELSPWSQAAQEDLGTAYFTGSLLRFVKGEWLLGQAKRLIGPTTPFLANMDEWYRGWIRWQNGGITGRDIGRVIDKFVVRSRKELGDLDRGAWESDSRGQLDPWQRVVYLVMRDLTTGEQAVFTSSSGGGIRSVAKLGKHFDQQRRRYPGKMPITRPSSETYPHPEFGKIVDPVFTIVGWDFWEHQPAEALPDEPLLVEEADDFS
jgi:hypothetical protein